MARAHLSGIDKVTILLERHHNYRFREHLNCFLPHVTLSRDLLRGKPLGHEDWGVLKVLHKVVKMLRKKLNCADPFPC